jgi:hypothetical protein
VLASEGSDEEQSRGDAEDAAIATPERRQKTWSNRGGLANRDFAAFTTREIMEPPAALARLV